MSELFLINKTIELDAAHRVPYHDSKCFNLHGHRYAVEATLTADELVPRTLNQPDSEMIADFSVLKRFMMETIHDPYDHRLILWEHDPIIPRYTSTTSAQQNMLNVFNSSVALIDCIPTAEGLAKYWFQKLEDRFISYYLTHKITSWEKIGLVLSSVVVYETPTSIAKYVTARTKPISELATSSANRYDTLQDR